MPKKIKPNGKIKEPLSIDPNENILFSQDMYEISEVMTSKKSQELKNSKLKNKISKIDILKQNAENMIRIGEEKNLYPKAILDEMKNNLEIEEYQKVIDLSFLCDYMERSSIADNPKLKLIDLALEKFKRTEGSKKKKRNKPPTRFTGMQMDHEDI